MKKIVCMYVLLLSSFYLTVEGASKKEASAKSSKKSGNAEAEIFMEFPAEAPSVTFKQEDLKQISEIVGQLRDLKLIDVTPLAQALADLKRGTLIDAQQIQEIVGKMSSALQETIRNAKTSSILDPNALADALERLKTNTIFDQKTLAETIEKLRNGSVFDTAALEKIAKTSMAALKDAISKIEFTVKPKDFSELTHVKLSIQPQTLQNLSSSLSEGTSSLAAGFLLCTAGHDMIYNGPNVTNVAVTGACIYQLKATPLQKRKCSKLCQRLFNYLEEDTEGELPHHKPASRPLLLMAPKPESKRD